MAVIPFADRFEANLETRNLLAHGFCEFLHTPAGDHGLLFLKWEHSAKADDIVRRRSFRMEDLATQRDEIAALADEAIRLVGVIHGSLVWGAREA